MRLLAGLLVLCARSAASGAEPSDRVGPLLRILAAGCRELAQKSPRRANLLAPFARGTTSIEHDSVTIDYPLFGVRRVTLRDDTLTFELDGKIELGVYDLSRSFGEYSAQLVTPHHLRFGRTGEDPPPRRAFVVSFREIPAALGCHANGRGIEGLTATVEKRTLSYALGPDGGQLFEISLSGRRAQKTRR